MASVEINQKLWNDQYGWKKKGDEWSEAWGGADMQWYSMLLPRLHHFVLTGNVLEIAPGQGRWTRFLAPMAKKLIAVDLSQKCIDICTERFKHSSHVHFYVNDGLTLNVVDDGSIDLAFSFDSLVHCEVNVIESYICELSKKLSSNGVGFIHHSNLDEYSTYFRSIRRIPRGVGLLSRLGLIESREHLRAHSVSAKKVEVLCQEYGLTCISQELFNWDSKRLIDCISVFCRKNSHFARDNRLIRNKKLTRERENIAALSEIYGERSFEK